MTDEDKAELARIAQAFLSPEKGIKDLLPEAQSLRDLFERLANFEINPEGGIGAGDTRLESGLAISPTTAAMCIRELYRTPAFIRGLGQAIKDSLHPGRPVRVLYAGCGPYALLAVPLMTAFTKEQAVFTLLDIHRECLDDAMALIDALGLSAYVDECVCADAVSYTIPADKMPDVIVSETMSIALHNEPQVSIARNLLSQAPAARMVPQSVSVEACVLDKAKEHVFMPADHVGEIPAPDRDRIYLGKIFELDAANIHRWQAIEGDCLPAGKAKIPSPLENRYHPYLLTRITVYGDTCLLDYDSSLTMPLPLPSKFNGGEELQFYYQFGNRPELRFETLFSRDARHPLAIGPGKTRYLRLPFFFDASRLKEDLAKISESEWVDHFNTAAYDKGWRCVPLRSVGGKPDHIISLTDAQYEDTGILERCPYFREVIDAFECEKTSVRLMSMSAGSRIKPHRDKGTSFEDGMARLHVPIMTAPEVLFSIEDEEIHFSAGHTWYLNADCLHGVRNDSPQPRIHLMLDCIVNPWLEKVFLDAGFQPAEKPKYGDPSINDDNVEAVIASLMAMEGGAGKQLAARLAAIREYNATP